MAQDLLLSKLIEISKNSDDDVINTLIQYQLEIEVQTLKQLSGLQALTIDLLQKTINQTIEMDELKKKIKTFQKVKKETDKEIQKLEKIRDQIKLE